METSQPTHGMGYIPDLGDYRDWRLPAAAAPRALPPLVDMRPQTVPIDDQGVLSSCVGNSCGSLFAFVDKKQGGSDEKPSRLQIYYDARALDGFQESDNGAVIRSALKTLADKGAAPEDLWPYTPVKVNVAPSQSVYDAATLHQAIAYMRVDQNLDAMRGCLADGFPFVLGSTLYESFSEVSGSGIVPPPRGSVIGGHAYLALGYRDSDRRFICQNSWGTNWGASGFFFISYDYLTDSNLSDDLWTIRSVEEILPDPDPDPGPDPEPVGAPEITWVKSKTGGGKLFVGGNNLSPSAILAIDGIDRRTVALEDGLLMAKKLGLTGGRHEVTARNPNGMISAPYVFNVLV